MNKNLSKKLRKKKKGFTLVELIIVIAIIAILAAMAIPKFGAMRTDAKISNDVAAAKNVQSTVARLVANGSIGQGATGSVSIADTDQVGKLIDGTKTPTAQGNATATFDYTVSAEGNVSVKSSAATTILAPAGDSTERDYKTALGLS